MKILIYSLNSYPEPIGIGKYSGEMESWFSTKGHQVNVVSAQPYYPEWRNHSVYKKFLYTSTLLTNGTHIHCPLYVPEHPTAVKRVLHLLSFSWSSAFALVTKLFEKPDVVILIQPTLFCAPFALLYARLVNAKAVMHIQDYELDAMFDIGMIQQGFLVKASKKIESWLMSRFDVVSTISRNMMKIARRKGVPYSRLLFFPNWADTDFITPDVDGAAMKSEWGFSENDKVVLYAGNIGNKQGLELVLDVAEKLQGNATIKFMIVGQGAHSQALNNAAAARGLGNVFFKPLQPWLRVPEMLSLADVHLVIQKSCSKEAFFPSKLTNILSSGGHAIVTAEKHTELRVLAEEFPGIYECIEPENAEDLTEALRSLLDMNLSQPNQIAREYAVEHMSAEKVLSRYEMDLKRIINHES